MSTARRRAAGLLVALLGVPVLLLAGSGTASAHPLGNFTVNRYSGIVVSVDHVTVDHVRDLAEIPTAQRRAAVDTSGDGRLARAELASWARSECRAAAGDLRLRVGGAPTPLAVRSATARSAPGQAGLPVLRLTCSLRADVGIADETAIRLDDPTAGREVGWREMTAVGDGVTLARSDVPRQSRSGRLTSYPGDLLSSPPDVTTARLVVRPGGPRLEPTAGGGAGVLARGADRLTVAFEGLASRAGGGSLVAVLALLAAVVVGAAHAVAPGHGKTVMAFYLSSHRASRVRAAVTVGATVTATHTAGVLLMGLLVSAGTSVAPARAYPWLSAVSGALIVAVGMTLLRRPRHAHAHPHADLPHGHHHHVPDHHHPHDHPRRAVHAEHGQAHAPEPSRRGLLAMGLAGGLVPSPSALVVLLAAVGLGHPWFGAGLVLAFGLGMAATLVVVGLLVLRLRDRIETRLAGVPGSRFAIVVRLLPVVTAATVVALGAVVAVQGLAGTGLIDTLP
jgi:ABC-type nickel/cobalt efflux system permease component RcnA